MTVSHGNLGDRTGSPTDLASLLDNVAADGRVCPMPRKWDELWKMLPNRVQVNGIWHPLPPLILAAWWHSTDEAKRERLASHLRYDADHGALEEIGRHIHDLVPSEWLCSSKLEK